MASKEETYKFYAMLNEAATLIDKTRFLETNMGSYTLGEFLLIADGLTGKVQDDFYESITQKSAQKAADALSSNYIFIEWQKLTPYDQQKFVSFYKLVATLKGKLSTVGPASYSDAGYSGRGGGRRSRRQRQRQRRSQKKKQSRRNRRRLSHAR